MIVFITGGAYQGKGAFAKTFGLPVLPPLHESVRRWLAEKRDIEGEIEGMLVGGGCAVVCDEVGAGVIPADKTARDYREAVGRAAIYLAKRADEVYRVTAGLPTRIK